MTITGFTTELAIAAGLLLGLLIAAEVGYRLGRARASSGRDVPGTGQVGAIQGATLGLLGLLLGFSFAAAAGRFLDRQDLITQEANAIGTAYLRADMLPEPHATRLRQVLAEYVAHRIEASRNLLAGLSPEVAAQVAAYHTRLWQTARDGVLVRPEMAKVVLDPVNGVIDLHTTRVAAGRKHLPLAVTGLIVACSLLAIGVIGYGSGLSGGRSALLSASLSLLIAAALWTTIDLDHARAGLIRLSDAPLRELDLRPVSATQK